MLSILCPDLYVPSICRVDLSQLTARGIRGIVLDIDNTFVDWGSVDIPAGVLAFLDDAKARGIRLCVLSNNLRKRIEAISRTLGIPAARGLKPMRSAFRAALALLGTSPQETAVIGDQIFTDILGGNLAGMYTILVVPTSRREFVTTRVIRRLERAVLGCLARRGMLALGGCEAPAQRSAACRPR
ncbi:MAG: YqeG family HAD IIIA-type phosphatase [Clostridia bacterium]